MTLNEMQFTPTEMRTIPAKMEGRVLRAGQRSSRSPRKTETRTVTQTKRGREGGKWKAN